MVKLLSKSLLAVGVLFALAGCKPCGNGELQANKNEQCDDGNNADGDGCSAVCLNEGAPVNCGDGTLQTAEGEQCDDGNTTAGDGCDALCQIENTGLCGNGNIDAGAGEQCDNGPANGTAGDPCGADCRLVQNILCGNGTVDAAVGEVCDDGNTTAGDGCRADCFGTEQCGDNLVDTAIGEECDPPGASCDLNCTIPAACNGLGVEGSSCTQSSECCQLANLGCFDNNADGTPDTCLPIVAGACPTCGTGADVHPCECCDGLDNDGDGGIDTNIGNNDLQCLGATDDNELEFATGIPGDNNGANGATECPFDGNSGPGNDGDCNLFLPNGCDCTLCCGLDGNGNATSENVFAGGGNCRDAAPSNTPGTEGGSCNFVDGNNDGLADNSGGCGTVAINGTTVNLNCIRDGDGTTAYCSTCVGCQNVLQDADPGNDQCINECNCCEACVGVQSPECDPALSDVNNDGVADLFDLNGDGTPETASLCPVGPGPSNICETNITCTQATAGTDCPDLGETCAAGSNGVEVCFQNNCTVSADCGDNTLFCNLGCCVPIP